MFFNNPPNVFLWHTQLFNTIQFCLQDQKNLTPSEVLLFKIINYDLTSFSLLTCVISLCQEKRICAEKTEQKHTAELKRVVNLK